MNLLAPTQHHPYVSKSATFSAFVTIKSRLGSTTSPIRVEKIWSVSSASVIFTCKSRRSSSSAWQRARWRWRNATATGASGMCRGRPDLERGTVSRPRSRSTFSHLASMASLRLAPVTMSRASTAAAVWSLSASSARTSACVSAGLRYLSRWYRTCSAPKILSVRRL